DADDRVVGAIDRRAIARVARRRPRAVDLDAEVDELAGLEAHRAARRILGDRRTEAAAAVVGATLDGGIHRRAHVAFEADVAVHRLAVVNRRARRRDRAALVELVSIRGGRGERQEGRGEEGETKHGRLY